MRHKQRPTKSSRHKSVTCIIDSHTSFGDHKAESRPQQQQKQHHHHHNHQRQHQQQQQQHLQQQPMRKQLEHNNYRHMSDVMRLAFLENNDIPIDDCSTASILQKNIQQHLRQERNEQLRQQEQQLMLQQAQYNRVDLDISDDYYLTDSNIFATATPHFSSNQRSHPRTSLPANLSLSSSGQLEISGSADIDDVAPQNIAEHVRGLSTKSSDGVFYCDEPGCGKQFPSQRKLRHHLVVHSDEFPYICEFRGCNKKFKRKFGIDLHSTTHFDLDPVMFNKTSNNSSLPFFGRRMQYSMCKPCGQKFKTVHEYQYHMLKHGKEPFKCPVKGCGQTFGIWKSFQKHRASHYFNYYCKMDPKCDHHTSNLQLLKLHIYCCHFKRKLPDNATLLSKDPANDANTKDFAPAELSTENLSQQTEEFEEEESFMQEDSPPEPELVPEPAVPTTPRRDSRLRKNPPRATKSLLSSGRPDISGSAERDIVPLSNVDHMQSIGTRSANGAFFCDEPGCGKQFPSYRKLRHHHVVHSDEFPYICEFRGCNKKFKRKFGIDLHSTTHFDLDPVMFNKTSNNSSLPFFGRRMQYSMCKPCGQKFKTVHEYQYHMLKHGKEPFKCPVKDCGQTFGIWKSFQKHRASHYFNYYCRMDPKCDHHTSNLQLLKLHIYCCHFKRKLPDNPNLLNKEPSDDAYTKDLTPAELSTEDSSQHTEEFEEEEEEESFAQEENPPKPKLEPEPEPEIKPEPVTPSTPRRDSRLRKNPPRSSTFGQQDYATINNGGLLTKSQQSTSQQKKRTRSAVSSSGTQSIETSSIPPEKKAKLPLKVLPKRSAQRLPMSMLADDSSTEDEPQYSSGDESQQNEQGDDDIATRNKFKCHLCDYKFSVRFQLTKHLSTHLELTPDMYSKTADKEVVQLSERRRREFNCEKCNIKFEQMSNLDDHMLRKHGQRPYTCNFCQVPSTFRIARQYLNHLYEHRFNYKCTMAPDCDFTINRKDALKLHIFRMHMNQQLPEYLESYARIVAATIDV